MRDISVFHERAFFVNRKLFSSFRRSRPSRISIKPNGAEPVRAPKANAYCERLIGTIRRECLDFLIPMSERHLKLILKEFVVHYNRGRPHSSLGPGIPVQIQARFPASGHRHKLPEEHRVTKTPILNGLHHEYGLEKEAA
jgi:putative transposase